MGRCIAICLARAGIKVLLCERSDQLCTQSLNALKETLTELIQHFSITEEEKKIYLSVIEATADASSLDSTDFVLECIDENLERKEEIFRQLDSILKQDKIIATNTSTLSITQLAQATQRPELVIGIHFIGLHPNSTLVEIVRGMQTSDSTVDAARDLVRQMRKQTIEVFEYPGYVSSRLVIPFINEALYILMEGVASAEDIDKAMTLGHSFPVGPLELADQIGLDQVMGMMEALFDELGELKYRPCPLLRKLVRAGRLGKKVGKGIFEYTNGRRAA